MPAARQPSRNWRASDLGGERSFAEHRQVLEIVRPTIEGGKALAVMGNHKPLVDYEILVMPGVAVGRAGTRVFSSMCSGASRS